MTAIAPRWLLSAQGLLAAADSHAADGYHFRIHASPLLGLPIVPFTVYRLGFDKPFRNDVIWIDSRGALLQPPFEVRGDNPVFGYLPAPDDGVCGWFQIKGTLGGGLGVPTTPVPTRQQRRSGHRDSPRATARTRAGSLSGRATAPLPALRLEAQVLTPRGWACVASRSKAPWVVTTTSIERVQVTGTGQVDQAKWVDLRQLPANIDSPIATLALPVEQGRRYKGVADAYTYARGQATRAASLRRALQEAPQAADPSAAPSWSAEQEGRRLDALDAGLVTDTQILVDDTARQSDVRRAYPITQNGSPLAGELSHPVLAGVLSAMQDPAVARLMGFMTRDDDPPMAADSGKLPQGLVYRVFGFWEVEERDGEYGVVQSLSEADQIELGRADIFWPLPADADVFIDRDELDARLEFHQLEAPVGLLGPVAELQTAVVTVANDPIADAPASPEITSIAAANPPFLPGTAPEARRRIDIGVGGLRAGAGLALARRTDAAPIWVSLNPRTGLFHPLIVPAASPTASEPGVGEIADRNAPPIRCDYRVAQSDVFGRWSGWSPAEVAAGRRPGPPRPMIEASFTPAVLPDPMHDAPLAGQIRVSVAVPSPDGLPPGAYLLDRVRVFFDGVEVASAPPGSGTTVVGSRPAPALTPASRAEVAVNAIWRDTAGQPSPSSNTVRVNCYDLRPPAPVVLANGLQYASRRDATGNCRAEVMWPVIPGQSSFRVYVSNETTVRTHLENLAAAGDTHAGDLLTSLNGMSAPDRAALLRAEKRLFPRNLFELLTDRPIVATSTARFEHALSASLRVLAFYRVVAVADTNVEAPFADSDLVAVAVPNSPAPRAPSIELASVDVPVPGGIARGVRVRITVAPGLSSARGYRLFRSTAETRDVGRMPLVASGTLPAVTAGTQVHTVLLVDDAAPGLPDPAVVGPYDEAVSADIRLWMRYHFRADVRGAPEPGSGAAGTREVPGIWSEPSMPASLLIVTADSPTAAIGLVFRSRTKTLAWQHPDELRGRHAGNYVFDVYRTLPGEREALFTSIKADAAFDQGGRKPDGSGAYHIVDPDATGGVRYRVVLGDPLGRPSPFAEVVI